VNIPDIHISPDDKQIIAAAIGALLGALGAYIVGLIVERRTKKSEVVKDDKARLREYSRSISEAEVGCQEALVILYDGIRLLNNCEKQIQGKGWMITLPRQINIGNVSVLNFRNGQLMTEWIKLRFKLDKLNHLINEFNSYYMELSGEFSRIALRGEEGVGEITKHHYETINGFASEVKKIAQETVENVMHVYTLITAHAELSDNEAVKIKSIEALSKFEVNSKHYKDIKKLLSARFAKDNT
jgi:hypothetical protein